MLTNAAFAADPMVQAALAGEIATLLEVASVDPCGLLS
jgi:hypothetical protein